MKKIIENHAFSVELRRKEHLKTVNIPSSGDDVVTIEGYLGKLECACFVEDSMLQIQGAEGTLRIDLNREEFKKLLQTKTEVKK